MRDSLKQVYTRQPGSSVQSTTPAPSQPEWDSSPFAASTREGEQLRKSQKVLEKASAYLKQLN